MKNAISLLVAFACGIVTAAAQDLIVKRDASRIEAKVSEVAPDAVRYKRWSNPDGPTYVLPVAQIDYIRYANGETERFAACETLPATPVTPATPLLRRPSLPHPNLRRLPRRTAMSSMSYAGTRSASITTATVSGA